MKKVLSLLFVALLAMTAWADVVVTVDFSQQGYNDSQQIHELIVDDVTLTFDKGTNSNNPPKYFNTGTAIRLYGGNTMTVTAETNIKKIDFTFASGEGNNDILCNVGNYNKAGKQWTIGSSDPANEVIFTIDGSSGHRRVQKLVITIEEANPVTELVPPVFNPNGGEFTGSLEVTLTCATENAEICYFEGEPDGDWVNWTHYNGPFYVTETKTLTAYSQKAGEMSEFVTVTFTKVEQTVEAPMFTPAGGGFYNSVNVTLTCATPNAKIYYSLDNELWSEYSDPIPVTTDLTIWAKAKVGDVESETVSATYTKLPDTTTEVTFDATEDHGDGETTRHHFSVVKEPVTMYVGDGTAYPTQYRIYKSDTTAFNFTSTGAPIIKIEIFGVSGNTASGLSLADGIEGTWTTGGNDGVWEGEANFVDFKVNSQVRVTKVIVTLAGPSTMRGDVNGNGSVNMDDLTALINYLVFESPINHDNAAICNSLDNNVVNMDDLTALINYLVFGHWDN